MTTEFATRGIARAAARRAARAVRVAGAGTRRRRSTAASVVGDAAGRRAFENLRPIVGACGRHDAPAARIRFDPSLARGLSYYTGAIMEIAVADLAGSLGGGGRYDNLVGMFLGQNVPACGFSLGLERIIVVMTERHMFPPTLATTPADVMVTVFDADGRWPHALRLAATLRGAGCASIVYPGRRQDRQAVQVR